MNEEDFFKQYLNNLSDSTEKHNITDLYLLSKIRTDMEVYIKDQGEINKNVKDSLENLAERLEKIEKLTDNWVFTGGVLATIGGAVVTIVNFILTYFGK